MSSLLFELVCSWSNWFLPKDQSVVQVHDVLVHTYPLEIEENVTFFLSADKEHFPHLLYKHLEGKIMTFFHYCLKKGGNDNDAQTALQQFRKQ